MTDSRQHTTSYVYDALRRLTQVHYPNDAVTFAYNAVGNRMAMTDTSGTTTYAYDLRILSSPWSKLSVVDIIGYSYTNS